MQFNRRHIFFCGVAMFVATLSYAQQSNPAVEQSRLFPRTIPPTAGNLTPEGMAQPTPETAAEMEESFGKQQILKVEEKIPQFTVTAGTSLFYTSNVALTRDDTRTDGFFVGETSFAWTPRISPELQFQLGAGASIFRYFETSALDFENLAFGTGLTWTPPHRWGLALILRYDLSELLDKHSDEILQDHQFSLALQKIVVLGRSHALSFGLIGSAGLSAPVVEQRDQAGFAIGYHLQLTRQLGSDFGYRHSWYFYNDNGRTDLNQVFSLGLRYQICPWASVNVLISGATNYSYRSSFKYDVFSPGGGLGVIIRF